MSWYKTSIETLRQNIYIQYSMKVDGKKTMKDPTMMMTLTNLLQN